MLYCSFKAALVSKSEDRQDDQDIFHGRKFESHKGAKNFKGGVCLCLISLVINFTGGLVEDLGGLHLCPGPGKHQRGIYSVSPRSFRVCSLRFVSKMRTVQESEYCRNNLFQK